MSDQFVVIARGGLKLRGGAGLEFPALKTVPSGTVVNVLSRTDMWAQVDLEGDYATAWEEWESSGEQAVWDLPSSSR